MRKGSAKPGLRKVAGLVRVAIYRRVSTVRQLEGYGLDTQWEECIRWLDFHIGAGKYKIVGDYADGGVSGKLASRPEFDKMNAAVDNKQIDLIIVGKLDRAGRTFRNIHRWIFDVTEADVRVVTADGNIDSEDDFFEVKLAMLAYMAQTEHTLILERTYGGKERKALEGGWPGGPVPYGLMIVGSGKESEIVVNSEEIKVLERLAGHLVEGKLPAAQAAEKVNAFGDRTRYGKLWCGASVIQRFQSTSMDGYVTFRNMERVGKTAAKRDDDGNPLYGDTIKIPVPLALPAERVAEVRKALERNSFGPRSGPDREYLLSRRLIGVCGNHYVGSYRTNRDNIRYMCTGRAYKKAEERCQCKEIDTATIDQAAWSEIVHLLGDRFRLRELADEWLGAVPNQIANYERRIAELEEKVQKKKASRRKKILALVGGADDDDFDEEMVEELKAELRRQEDQLEEQIEETRAWLIEAQGREEQAKKILDMAEKVRPELESLDMDQRLDLLALLDVKVLVRGEVPGQVRQEGDSVEKWFTDSGYLVPDELTDSQWEKVRRVIPPMGRKDGMDMRLLLEGVFYKLREGIGWKDLPADRWPTYRPPYNRSQAWLKDGTLKAVITTLGDYPGSEIPPAYQLPPLHITGTFDPRITREVRAQATRAVSEKHECGSAEDSRLLLASVA